MRNLIIIILCFAASKAFSQTNEAMVEEKASDWIKVTSPVSEPRSRNTTTIRKNTSRKKTSIPKQDAGEEFEKTNNQVNRFKKVKKD